MYIFLDYAVMDRKSRADSRLAANQWETALLCNNVSHWLGTSLESASPTYQYLDMIHNDNVVP